MVTQNAIEYITRDLFKGKSLKISCNNFIKKFGNTEACFIGNVDYSAEDLMQAVLKDKAQLVSKFEYLPSVATRFNLKLSDLQKAFEKA